MKKTKQNPKLVVRSETIVHLPEARLVQVAGGFLMKDTIIIRTGG